MMLKLILIVLITGVPLGGQVDIVLAQKVVLKVQPARRGPQLRQHHGRYQAVIIHRLEVAPGATLIMKALRGDVVMLGTDVHRIVIEEKISVRTRHKDHALETIERVKGELTAVKGKEASYVFKVGQWSERNVYFDYKVKIPKKFNLLIQSYGGDFDMSDLHGDLEAKTGGGDIALSKSGGKIRLRTGGGDIDLYQVEGQVSVFTGGGDIEGRTIQGQVEAQTGGGDIEFWRCEGNFTFNTGGGDIEVQGLEGTELDARTGGGDIVIGDIIARVNLLTGGGDIVAEAIDGAIEAATSGGDVDLRRVNGDAILYSGAGDISIRRIAGAVQIRNNSGDISVEEMTLAKLGRDKSTITTSYGDVWISLSTALPVAITAKLLGVSPHYAVDRMHTNLDFKFRKSDGYTVASFMPAKPVHTITIETHGEIEISQGDE